MAVVVILPPILSTSIEPMSAANKIIRLKEAAQMRSDQRVQMRLDLAGHAIDTLAELGFARTSMRDIAAQSGRSIGSLNYYFEDKTDLISFCVRLYKEQFVIQVDAIIEEAKSPRSLAGNFIEGMVETIENDARTHRLWYDIRSQSLFDEAFVGVVSEIEQALVNMIGRLLTHLDLDSEDPKSFYYLLDGSFRYHLQQQLQENIEAGDNFRKELQAMFKALQS